MRLLRSRQGKVALEIGGNAIIQFLRVTSEGPKFDASERRAFFSEYNRILDVDPFEAILSFTVVAKRGYRHQADVCAFLWEQIMSKNFSDMTLAELISVYNKLAASKNKGQRKSFSSKAEAISAIERLDALVKEPTVEQLQNQGKIMTQTVDENGNVVETVAAEKKPRGKGIGKRAMELILEGKTNAEVIDVIKQEIEGANPTPATMAWYRNKLRQEGKLAPSNRKAKGEAVEAEAEVEAEDEAA